MKNRKLTLIILLPLCSGFMAWANQLISGNAHTPVSLVGEERQLEAIYTRWVECTTTHFCQEGEKLDNEFSSQLSNLLLSHPETFQYPFTTMVDNEMIDLFTSADGKLRVYNWHKFAFTSMQELYTVYQFESAGHIIPVLSKKDSTTGDIMTTYDKVSALHTVTIGNKNYYFMVRNTMLSSNDIIQSIECMTVEKGKLNRDAPIFKTRNKTFGSIDVNFLRASMYDPETEMYDERDAFNLITYDAEKRQILIPVVNEDMEVQKSYLVYQLKGNYFEYTGIKK